MSKDSFFFVELRSQMCFDIYINMFLSSFFFRLVFDIFLREQKEKENEEATRK